MPKIKTHKGTRKRVRVSKNGKVLHQHPMRNHFLQKKSAAKKRDLAGFESVTGKAKKTIKMNLGE